MKAIDSGSDAPQMLFDVHSYDGRSMNYKNSSSSSSEDFRQDPYKISKLNQELKMRENLTKRQSSNQNLTKQDVDEMILSYMKKNGKKGDYQIHSDEEYIQESMDMISESGNRYPSY